MSESDSKDLLYVIMQVDMLHHPLLLHNGQFKKLCGYYGLVTTNGYGTSAPSKDVTRRQSEVLVSVIKQIIGKNNFT